MTYEEMVLAATDLLGETGVDTLQLRYCSEETPTVWMAVGVWTVDGKPDTEVGAGLDPLRALFKLCDAAMDGSQCVHCERPTGFIADVIMSIPSMSKDVCWYQFDPGAKKYIRSCE